MRTTSPTTKNMISKLLEISLTSIYRWTPITKRKKIEEVEKKKIQKLNGV